MSKNMRRWEMGSLGPTQLSLKTVPVPTPGPGEVLVKIKAVALNYRDKLVIESGMGMDLAFPFTPGSDFAGVVEACGEGVRRVSVGDRVISTFSPDWIDGTPEGSARNPPIRSLGGVYPGVLADYVAFPDDWFAKAPDSLDDAEASTLPCAGLTSWFALVERGKLRSGQWVLIQGTGGVAMFALQIAQAHGARVIVTSRSPEKLSRVRKLGVEHCIDTAQEDLVEAVYRITEDHGADHVLELVGGQNLDKAVKVAAIGGQIHQIGVLDGFDLMASAGPLMLKNVTVHGIAVGHRRALDDLVSAVKQAGLKPVIDGRYPLADLPSALAHLDRGAFGKVVVEMG